MDVGSSIQRMLGRWAETLGGKDGSGSSDPVAQRQAARYGPPSCALCGRRLLPGEPLSRFAIDGDVAIVCPVCEPDALVAGYLRVRPEGRPERWSTWAGQVTRVERRPATEAEQWVADEAPTESHEAPPGDVTLTESHEAPSVDEAPPVNAAPPVAEGALPALVEGAAPDETAAGRRRGTRLKSAA